MKNLPTRTRYTNEAVEPPMAPAPKTQPNETKAFRDPHPAPKKPDPGRRPAAYNPNPPRVPLPVQLFGVFLAVVFSAFIWNKCQAPHEREEEFYQPATSQPASAATAPTAGRHPASLPAQVEEVSRKLNSGELLTLEEQTVARQYSAAVEPRLTSEWARVRLLAHGVLGNKELVGGMSDTLRLHDGRIAVVLLTKAGGINHPDDLRIYWLQSIFVFDPVRMRSAQLYNWHCYEAVPRLQLTASKISRITLWGKNIRTLFSDGTTQVVPIRSR